MVVFTRNSIGQRHSPRCKRLTKWWSLQGPTGDRRAEEAANGLQNGGIYKVVERLYGPPDAVIGLQNGVLPN